MHASNVHTSLITRISAMSAHGWVRVMLMPNWGGGGVLTKHPLDKATRKKAPGPSWCRPLSRGAEGRRIWPAMTRSATCPSVATSSYSSLPSSPYNPLYPRKLTPAALPPHSLANRRTRPRTDSREPNIELLHAIQFVVGKQIEQQSESMNTLTQNE